MYEILFMAEVNAIAFYRPLEYLECVAPNLKQQGKCLSFFLSELCDSQEDTMCAEDQRLDKIRKTGDRDNEKEALGR